MWREGILAAVNSGNKYKYWVKHYEEGSEYGIGGGRISKLQIRKLGETKNVYNFDRGIDLPPINAEVETILNIILAKYN
jgi:hypothetical protein